jgi:hypothetical protein
MLQSFVLEPKEIYDGLVESYDRFADGHPTSKGYEQIAGEIFDYININDFIPCD